MLCSNESIVIEIGARSSPLSLAQVEELLAGLRIYYPRISFKTHLMQTVGDLDQTTSLRLLGKSDFFTRDIDTWILEGTSSQDSCGRVGIHSAKDLSEPLRDGLSLFCMTKSIHPGDSLVISSNETLKSLPKGAKIATSSIRREELVKELRDDFQFCDVRGTIEKRLELLQTGAVKGVVIAEAALIRLGLTHLNRIPLPGVGVDGQGQLAVVGRSFDNRTKTLFSIMHEK